MPAEDSTRKIGRLGGVASPLMRVAVFGRKVPMSPGTSDPLASAEETKKIAHRKNDPDDRRRDHNAVALRHDVISHGVTGWTRAQMKATAAELDSLLALFDWGQTEGGVVDERARCLILGSRLTSFLARS